MFDYYYDGKEIVNWFAYDNLVESVPVKKSAEIKSYHKRSQFQEADEKIPINHVKAYRGSETALHNVKQVIIASNKSIKAERVNVNRLNANEALQHYFMYK